MPSATAHPYQPSWVDRLIDWIEGLPIPSWLFYVLFYLVTALGLHIPAWLNGNLPWWAPSAVQFYSAVWLPGVLIVIHDGDRVAKAALERFAPLVRDQASQLETLQYQMTTMPARPVFWMFSAAAIMLLISAFNDPSLLFIDVPAGPIHPLAWALAILFGITSYSLAPAMIYHAVRQLNLITKAYAMVRDVNVFHQQPLYAFSGLTMRTSLYFVAMVYITYASRYIYEVSSSEATINLILTILILPLSLAIVLIPLNGIHHRLVRAKEAVLEENSTQIASTRGQLYVAIEKQNNENIKGMDNAMSSLYKEREHLKAIPTWPWAPGALRNFLSAVFLPMLLWLLQTLAARFL